MLEFLFFISYVLRIICIQKEQQIKLREFEK